MAASNLNDRIAEELLALEARNRSLQTLVAELLLINQQLRLDLELAHCDSVAIATATHPPPRQDR